MVKVESLKVVIPSSVLDCIREKFNRDGNEFRLDDCKNAIKACLGEFKREGESTVKHGDIRSNKSGVATIRENVTTAYIGDATAPAMFLEYCNHCAKGEKKFGSEAKSRLPVMFDAWLEKFVKPCAKPAETPVSGKPFGQKLPEGVEVNESGEFVKVSETPAKS